MKNFVVWLLELIRPIVKKIGAIHIPFSRKKVTGVHYYAYRDQIFPGTILLSSTNGEFSNILNPMKIKHGGIYIGMFNNIGYVLEATGKGVYLKDLVTFMTTKDLVMGLNPKIEVNETDLRSKIDKYLGASYDYQFSSDNKSYYCYELIAKIYNDIYPNIEIKMQETLFKHMVYGPESFLQNEHFELVFNTEERK